MSPPQRGSAPRQGAPKNPLSGDSGNLQNTGSRGEKHGRQSAARVNDGHGRGAGSPAVGFDSSDFAGPPVGDKIKLSQGLRLYRENDLGGVVDDRGAGAYSGPIGQILGALDGETEATLPAIGGGLLALLGARIGRHVRFRPSDLERFIDELACAVGTSARSIDHGD